MKKVQIRSDVTAGGTKVSAVKVDPLLVGVGLGFRFLAGSDVAQGG
jgi:outer membrane protein